MKNVILRKFALPATDWKSVLKGLGIAVLGSALTYLSANITNADFGQYTYLVVPIVTVVVNILRKVVFNDTRNVIGLSVDEKKDEVK
jgi:hypothetical protein